MCRGKSGPIKWHAQLSRGQVQRGPLYNELDVPAYSAVSTLPLEESLRKEMRGETNILYYLYPRNDNM